MNAAQALSRLRKLLGPKAAIEDGRRPSSPEQRDQQRATRSAVVERKKAAEFALTARRQAILAADADYQRLLGEYNEAHAVERKTPHGTYHRYTAGRVSSMFFHVEAEADTLAELIEVVERKRSAA